MSVAQPPLEACPKCGDREGFRSVEPHWRAPEPFVNSRGDHVEHPDYLDWYCRTCGYEVPSPPLDRQP